MENLAKLPKWARDRIVSLERQVETLSGALADRNGEAVGGRVQINPYSPTKLLFSDDSLVRFSLGASDWRDYFEVRLDGVGVRVRSGGPMLILPQVTNSILLKPAED
jgi:hypothetical protein